MSEPRKFLPEKKLFGDTNDQSKLGIKKEATFGMRGSLLDQKKKDEINKYNSPDKRLGLWRQ